MKPVGGSLVAFELDKGEHEIVITYFPSGFWPGLAVSVFCMLVFAALCFLIYVKKFKIIPESVYSELNFPENEVYDNLSEETVLADEPVTKKDKKIKFKNKK